MKSVNVVGFTPDSECRKITTCAAEKCCGYREGEAPGRGGGEEAFAGGYRKLETAGTQVTFSWQFVKLLTG
jgi:hypothetical protein